jgi:hypothetical protein
MTVIAALVAFRHWIELSARGRLRREQRLRGASKA